MCGLVVCVDAESAGASPEFEAGLDMVSHRGPDDRQVAVPEPGVVFGFHRLRVVDPAGSRQPLHYAGRWTVCFNGEIYNYRDLRAELERDYGAGFATNGDAEVLAAAFHHWGAGALDRLRGMFAFVIWDARERVLHAARDPFGIKPLYYLQDGTRIWLASEKKSLRHLVGDAVDTDALAHYLSLQYVPEPYTLHERIRRVPAGGRLTWPAGGPAVVERYFRPGFEARPAGAATHLARELGDALRDSVRAHLVADVPVGAFLSGGVDSTAVVALAREERPDLTVFSAGFDVDGYSELEDAALTADLLGVRMVPTVVTAADVAAALPRIVWHLDDPLADPALTPLYFLSATAARHVTVVLSGEGADELFGGYGIYREPAAVAPVQNSPAAVRRALRRLARVLPEGVKGKSYLLRATTPIEDRYYGNARIFDGAEKVVLMRGRLAASRIDLTAAAFAATAHLDDVSRMQTVDLATWLPGDILTKADRMSMAHSLELRVPYLDPAVYDVARRVPARLRVPPGRRVTKYLLREAVRGLVPDAVVDRPKLGFATPTRVWLRGDLNDWAHDVLSRSGAGDLLDLSYARRLLVAHERRQADNSRKVWTVLMFCLWHAVFVERSLDPDQRITDQRITDQRITARPPTQVRIPSPPDTASAAA